GDQDPSQASLYIGTLLREAVGAGSEEEWVKRRAAGRGRALATLRASSLFAERAWVQRGSSPVKGFEATGILDYRKGGGMGDSPRTRLPLLARVRDVRDGSAWAELVELYAPLVYALARRHGLQDADAADLAQEVLRAAVGALPRF